MQSNSDSFKTEPASKAYRESTLDGGAHGVADTTSQSGGTRKMVVGIIRAFQDVTGAIGTAILENSRGVVKGVGLVGADVGALAKGAIQGLVKGATEVSLDLGSATKCTALGLLHGTAEVGTEFGKLCKSKSLGAIKGVGEVSADLGTMAKTAALGAIKGTTEAALSLEEAAIVTARAVIRDVGTLRSAPGVVGKVESVEVEPSPDPIVTGSTNILSIAPVVVAGTRRKRSKG